MQARLEDKNVIALRIYSDDKVDLTPEETDWMRGTCINSGPEGDIPSIITYWIRLSDEFFHLLERYNNNAIKPALFFFFKQLCEDENFCLKEHDAFDTVTALYSRCIHVLRPGVGEWHFSQVDTYEVRFDANTRSLSIVFPKLLIGLLIGKQRASINSLRSFLEPTIREVTVTDRP